MNVLTDNIRNRRKTLGLTQKELAEQLNISDKTVSRWESGRQMPDAELLPELARVLGCGISELYGEEQTEEQEQLPAARDERKDIFTFRVLMIVGAAACVLGAVIYRYFSQVVYAWNRVIDIEYYNTAKGAAADILAMGGIVFLFAGIAVMIIGKARLSMQYKPPLSDSLLQENIRYSGLGAVAVTVAVVKIAPQVLSFGFVVPKYVYGFVIAAAVTALMIRYKRELRARDIRIGRALNVICVVIGVLGLAAQAGAEWIVNLLFLQGETVAQWLQYITIQPQAAATVTAVADVGVILMPLILYIELLVKTKKLT